MQNSVRHGSVSTERVALDRKATNRANSVPLMKMNPGDLPSDGKVVINVEELGSLIPKMENDSRTEFLTALKEANNARHRRGSCAAGPVGRSVHADTDCPRRGSCFAGSVGRSVHVDIDCPRINRKESSKVSASAHHLSQRGAEGETKPIISATISTASSISDKDEETDEVLDSPPPSPGLPRAQNAPEQPNKQRNRSITSSTVLEKRDSVDYKLEQNDKLLANLGPLPQIVKTQAPIKKKSKSRDLLCRLLSRGGVEEADVEYAQHGASAGGGSGSEDGGSGPALGADGRLLQAPDGRVRVEVAEEPEGESSLSILMQVMLPFLVAGLGMVGAGLVLDIVQHWGVFTEVSELFIMVPALLGLKGNLEMTLASRLSTHANMGHLDKTDDCISMIVGNLALIQCQAIVVGFLASVAAVVMGWIPEGEFNFLHALLLCAGALVTASFASFILGVIMVAVILVSRKCRINPDNVATPIAASLGDLTTLGLLAWIASLLFDARASELWLAPLIIAGYLLSLPLWVWLASRNKHTKEVLYSGWTPVISAMMISSMGGVILDYTVSSYKGIAVYQPVINGVGGNLVAVQASRISTALHLATPLGRLPRYAERLCHNPATVFCSSTSHARTARVLLLLVIPGHLIFAYTISYLKAGHTSLTPIFVVVYLCAAVIQVVVLLYMAVVMVHWMWSVCIDPDNSAIPYLTACGDLLGTGLLAIAFHLLYLVGDKDSDLGD